MSGGEDDDRRIFVGGLNYTSQEDDIRQEVTFYFIAFVIFHTTGDYVAGQIKFNL